MAYQSSQTSLPILTGYGILDREFRKQMGYTSPNFSDLSFLRTLKKMDKIRPSESTGRYTFYYYEQLDHLKSNATIQAAANATLNGTPSIDITLSPADHYNSGANSWPIKGNMVLFANQVSGYVFDVNRTTPNAHVVRIKSLTNSTDVQTAAVLGSTINFGGVSVSEASSGVEMRNPRINRINQTLKITRGQYSTTDAGAQNRIEVKVGPNGEQFLYPLGIGNTMQTFEMDEEMAMLTENLATTAPTDLAGNAITSTLGLIPNINSNGQTMDYYGNVDMATVDDWVQQLVANYADGEYLLMAGLRLGQNMKNWMVNLGQYDATYAFFEKGGKEMALNLNFTAIKMPMVGIELYVKDCKVFSHAGSLGAQNLPYQNMGLLIPAGQALNSQTNEMQPYLQIRYAQPAGAPQTLQSDGEIQVWETGANAQNGPTSDKLERNIHMVSYKAIQAFNLRKFGVITQGF